MIGVATQNIANGDFGYITWFGKVNGVYTIELPADNIQNPNHYGLYSLVSVADMPKGTYNYRISKSYPSGRTETFSDTVTIVKVIDGDDAKSNRYVSDVMDTAKKEGWVLNPQWANPGAQDYIETDQQDDMLNFIKNK